VEGLESDTDFQHVVRKDPRAHCEKCSLALDGAYVPTQQPTSPPDGPHRLAIVGEAPGVQESYAGKPFIGPSGKLLQRVLDHYGIERRSAVVTNAALCRPRDGGAPPASAIAACRPRLLDDLAEADQVLALGNVAARSLLQTTAGITKLRVGPPREWNGKSLVTTFHPAACLRNGDFFPSLLNDAGKLVREQPAWEPPSFVVVDEEQQALEAIAQLHTLTDRLVVDIECGIEKDSSFDHPNEYEMLCVGVQYAKKQAIVFGENSLTEKVWAAMKDLFNAKKLIAQNGKFDFEGLYRYLGRLRLWFDTMLAHYCLDERPGNHGLKYLAVELLGAPEYDRELAQYLGPGKNYGNIPRPVLYRYNAYDVDCTWELCDLFETELERLDLRKLHDFLVSASNELMFLELNGIKFDAQWNSKLADQYIELLSEMEEVLDGLVDKDYDKSGGINPRSPKQLQALFGDHNIRLKDTTADTLEALLARLDAQRHGNVARFVGKLLEHRREAKRYGTYVKGLRRRMYRGRIFTTYLLHGSTSGRLASRNPNLQNIVRDDDIRRQFRVTRDGNVLVQLDYGQAEGRVMTTLAQDSYLRSIFIDPTRDLFTELGKKLYDKDGLTENERVRVKAYFYGLGYGREAFSIAAEYGWSVREAERDVAAFKHLIPGVTAWQERVQQRVLSGRDLITTFGRHRRFTLITRENRNDVLKEALSFLPQSTASDICLRALIDARPKLVGLGHIRLTIHDAITAECPIENLFQVTEILRTSMVGSGAQWTDYVPFVVDAKIGESWGDLKKWDMTSDPSSVLTVVKS
jgi:uracil-DNA glycosylase family 4